MIWRWLNPFSSRSHQPESAPEPAPEPPQPTAVQANLVAPHFHTLAADLPGPKPVENQVEFTKHLDATDDDLALALQALVEQSAEKQQNTEMLPKDVVGVDAQWIERLIPGLERLIVDFHMGNFVIIRETGEKVFESMPIYARIGMHLLFRDAPGRLLLKTKTVRQLLKDLSIQQGQIYDSPASVSSIPSFIQTYSLEPTLHELLESNPYNYPSFNAFFYRALKPGSRPIKDPSKEFCSIADCRLMVYDRPAHAQAFWIKGKKFTIPRLLGRNRFTKLGRELRDGSLAIFRLAPADYHRFHSPLDGVVEGIYDLPGEYYTVNPQAVTQPGLDVFTANRRSVLLLRHKDSGKRVAFVAIGALLVGGIVWTGAKEVGKELKKGDEVGYFAYGGSTVVVVFPKGMIEFDKDLVKNSETPIETYVKVGDSLGKMKTPPKK